MYSAVGDVAARVTRHLVETDVRFQLKSGVQVERLRTGSATELEAEARFARDILTRLDVLDVARLDADDRDSTAFVHHLMTNWIAAAEHHLVTFTITPYARFLQTYSVNEALSSVAFTSEDDVERYLSLTSDYRDAVRELSAHLREQARHDIRLPRPAIAGAREGLLQAVETVPSQLQVDDARLVSLAKPLAGRLREGLTVAAEEIRVCYRNVLDLLDADYAARAPADVGQAQYAGGLASYRALVQSYTTSTLTPEEIHSIGLDQVRELTEAMAEARARLGAARDEAEFHAQLAADPRMYASDVRQVEARYLQHMSALEPHLGSYFAILPKAPYGVARLAPELEAGMTYGYYQEPTLGEPTGRYMYNGSALEKRSMLTAASLIFHELAPGHHFHVARQRENADLPEIRRDPNSLSGFCEGWAEYAAGLCWEMGIYREPHDAYGRLVHERFTAARLVVDTGMNALGWTLRQGAEYLRANTLDSEAQIASETLRYATDIPAQALCYRLGFIEFERMRSQARQELGSRFDIREFHEVLLGPGALPFGRVAANVAAWIDAVRIN